jgi:hypothetical protein
LHPRDFAWANYPTAANPMGRDHLERLVGSAAVRTSLESTGAVAADLTSVPSWEARVAGILRYSTARDAGVEL